MKRKLQHKKIDKKIKQVKNQITHREPVAEELVTGVLSLSSRGFGFVTPEGKQKNEDDIFILKSGLHTAMNGDTVQVRLFPQYAVTPGRSKEGAVYKVIERANSKIVGIFSASRNFGFVSPDDTRIREDIYIPYGQFLGAKTGDKVVFTLSGEKGKTIRWIRIEYNDEDDQLHTETLDRQGDGTFCYIMPKAKALTGAQYNWLYDTYMPATV